jgi:hypothetical protein
LLNEKKKSKLTEPMSISAEGAGDLKRAGGAAMDDELPESETKEAISDDLGGEDSDEVKEVTDGASERGRESKGGSKTDSSEEKDSDANKEPDKQSDNQSDRDRDGGESKRERGAKFSEDATSGEEKTGNTPDTAPCPSAPSLVNIMKNKIHPRMKVLPSIHFALSSSVSSSCR